MQVSCCAAQPWAEALDPRWERASAERQPRLASGQGGRKSFEGVWLGTCPSLRVFQGYRAALDAVSQCWHRLQSSATKKNYNLIGKGGQFWGSLARDSWGEDAGVSKASLQRMLHSSVETGAKGGTGRNFAAEFCQVVWSYDKNTSSIFQDTIFFVVLVSFLVNACILFLLV